MKVLTLENKLNNLGLTYNTVNVNDFNFEITFSILGYSCKATYNNESNIVDSFWTIGYKGDFSQKENFKNFKSLLAYCQ